MEIKRKKILITDDGRGYVLYLSSVLNKLGFQVIPAVDGNEVTKLMGIVEPDMVVLDANVPGRNAREVLMDIQKKPGHSDIPVIMLFAQDQEDQAIEASRSGAAEFIVKPLDLNVFHDVMQNYLFRTSPRRRKHVRCPFNKTVAVRFEDIELELGATSLSEGGIYLKKSPPLPVGSSIEVLISLYDRQIPMRGTVIYKNNGSMDELAVPAGMAVEFRGGAEDDLKMISDYVIRELEQRT